MEKRTKAATVVPMAVDEQESLRAFCERLGHSFINMDVLRDALTHRSLRNERPSEAPIDNERLEFLGDAILGAEVASLLFEKFPDAKEGELTRRRADNVSERAFCALAIELGLGEVLRLGKGEDRSGGREKPRLLASAFESCIGAVYIDGGREAARQVVRTLLLPKLEASQAPGAHDFKSRIQERLQAEQGQAPLYRVVRTEGPDHARRFFVSIEINGKALAEGNGHSKVAAEQDAARLAMSGLT